MEGAYDLGRSATDASCPISDAPTACLAYPITPYSSSPATTAHARLPTMGGPSATQHAPKSLLELEDLLKDDIKVKVAGKRGPQR